MKTGSFSKLSALAVIALSLVVFAYLAYKAAHMVRSPFGSASATDTADGSSTAGGAGPSYLSESLSTTTIRAPKGSITAMIASTSAEQELGLSHSPSLPSGSGMLFPFQSPGDYGFWMPNMDYDLDMVWISSDKKVAGVSRDVPADSYPEVFYPPTAISYVLEVNAGAAEELGIATGTKLDF